MGYKVSAVASDSDKHTEDVECAVFMEDTLYTGGDDGNIKAWNDKLELIRSWRAHQWVVYDLAVDLENKTLYSCSMDGEIKKWGVGGLDTGEPRCEQQATQTGPSGEFGGGAGGETAAPATVRTLQFQDNSLFAGDQSGTLCRWSRNLELQNKMEYYTEIWSMVVDREGQTAYTVRDNDLVVADIRTGARTSNIVSVSCTFPGRAPVRINGSDTELVCCNRKGMDIQVLRRSHREEPYSQVQLLSRHDMIVNSILMEEKGSRLVSGGWDQRLVIWELEGDSYKHKEDVSLESYVNVICGGREGCYYVGGKAGYLVRVDTY